MHHTTQDTLETANLQAPSVLDMNTATASHNHEVLCTVLEYVASEDSSKKPTLATCALVGGQFSQWALDCCGRHG